LDNGEKEILLVNVTKNMAELCFCSSVSWKAELASNESGYLASEMSKEQVKIHLTAYSKV
jgi:hypothetical protein